VKRLRGHSQHVLIMGDLIVAALSRTDGLRSLGCRQFSCARWPMPCPARTCVS